MKIRPIPRPHDANLLDWIEWVLQVLASKVVFFSDEGPALSGAATGAMISLVAWAVVVLLSFLTGLLT